MIDDLKVHLPCRSMAQCLFKQLEVKLCPLILPSQLQAAQGKCSWFSSQKATAEIQRLQQALVQQLRLHACFYR